MNVTFNLSLTQSHFGTITHIMPVERAPRSDRGPPRPSGAARLRSPSVLVVTNSDEDRYLLSRLLERQSFAVYEACSGQQAIALVDQLCPDIMLLDVMIPGLPGPVLMRALHAQDDALPVIVLGTTRELAALEQCLAEGAKDFVFKPVEWPELHLRIQTHLRSPSQVHRPGRVVHEIWA